MTLASTQNPVELTIIPRTGDIGGFEVRRALPFRDRRMVGPFIFWDQMGPGEFLTGQGLDVRPHPHIGLSTVTYLFEGAIDHRDSVGSTVRITPGDVNLMTAGRGIVHSERSGPDLRQAPQRIAGIQSWLALPRTLEDCAPSFAHTPVGALPSFADGGVSGRVILGRWHGLQSPVDTPWDTLYVDLTLAAGARIDLPATTEERALYGLSGRFELDGTAYDPGRMLVLHSDAAPTLTAIEPVRLLLLGGATMDGPRFIDWNFVATSRARIEQAKEDWRARRFPLIPGDADEFVPLPA